MKIFTSSISRLYLLKSLDKYAVMIIRKGLFRNRITFAYLYTDCHLEIPEGSQHMENAWASELVARERFNRLIPEVVEQK